MVLKLLVNIRKFIYDSKKKKKHIKKNKTGGRTKIPSKCDFIEIADQRFQ